MPASVSPSTKWGTLLSHRHRVKKEWDEIRDRPNVNCPLGLLLE